MKNPLWEQHLIIRAQAGDVTAFESLVALHRQAIFSQAIRMLRDWDDAQDAVQETFLKACRALHNFEAGRPMLPWLLRICGNCCVDMIRTRKVAPDTLENHEFSLSDTKANVAEGVESSMGVEDVENAISRLPDRYREIVLMRHFRHMDVNEIACVLNKPEGTIKSWLFRARALLRRDLHLAAS